MPAEGIVLTLRTDGSIALDGNEIPWESVTTAIRDLAEQTGAVDVIVRGDENVPYGRVVAALDRIRLAGLDSITLQTERSGD
jgi:biopolymer transport protein ExbD